MFEDDGAIVGRAILDRVGLRLAQVILGRELVGADGEDHVGAGRLLGRGLDLGALIEGVAEETFLVRLQVEDASVAAEHAAVVDGDRALRERLARGVLELQAQERELSVDRFVVDAELLPLDGLIEDRQHGGLLPGERDFLIDGVLIVIANFVGKVSVGWIPSLKLKPVRALPTFLATIAAGLPELFLPAALEFVVGELVLLAELAFILGQVEVLHVFLL